MLEALHEASMICLKRGKGDACLIHLGAAHDVEACPAAEDFLQRMVDQGLFEVCSAKKGEQDV